MSVFDMSKGRRRRPTVEDIDRLERMATTGHVLITSEAALDIVHELRELHAFRSATAEAVREVTHMIGEKATSEILEEITQKAVSEEAT